MVRSINGWKGDDEVSWLGSRDKVTTVIQIKKPKILREFQHVKVNLRNIIQGMVVGFSELKPYWACTGCSKKLFSDQASVCENCSMDITRPVVKYTVILHISVDSEEGTENVTVFNNRLG